MWRASKKALEIERTRLQRETEAANERAEIERQLAEERRRQLRFQRRVSAMAVLTALFMAIIGFFDWIKWNDATQARDEAKAAESALTPN